ncbi:glycoside hydrolase family 16 protein [Natranaeroarchaeum aerophilus]|uniref:Family 16 glycosylhydrolase n=1 Tax=Natranaeroarchaeum aerophilus TaxID=2917711 RepID=A0AAE3FQI0_9EURY|nr:family 16 glycosylhydrolase [Natranaeroarchaeum aerophilus]MCL9813458.1 family 16 glycosylhydrolase [Natranaeroarchaeum aerophilus]
MPVDQSRRRHLLVTLGALAGSGCLIDDGGDAAPPVGDPERWRLVVDEQWERFDTDRWAVGFIDREEWIPDDDATVSSDHVTVRDGQCLLEVESTGAGPEGCFQGVINSSAGGEPHHPGAGIPIDPVPGQYVEASFKLPDRRGVLPGFWMHPANMHWPPEIDIIELLPDGESGRGAHVDVHWSRSGEPADMETHEHSPQSVDVDSTVSEEFNTYGCAWFEDRIEWYVNDRRVRTLSGPPAMLESLTASAARPFGLIFSNHVNRLGQAPLDKEWTEQLVIDWVRVWERTG